MTLNANLLRRTVRMLRHRLRARNQFYSPLVNPYDARVRRLLDLQATSELPKQEDLQLDSDLILRTLSRIAAFYGDLPFSASPQAGLRYFYDNPAFSYGDAIVLFGMIRYWRPKRVIEVGSGYSSCVMMDTNDRFFQTKIELAFIDPYPETLKRLLLPNDAGYKSRIKAEAIQDVPTDVFTELDASDILFLDSSHVSKTASDVNDYLFRILPALRSGVIIHVHDIPYPFEYPLDWVLHENKSWNEAYLLRAFLQYNNAFEVIYFNHFVYRRFEEALRSAMPLCLKNCGASLWLRKK